MRIPRIPWPEEWRRKTRLLRGDVTYSAKDFIVSMSMYILAVVLCIVLRHFDTSNESSYVAVIFLLDVFLTALLTDGYLFSVLMALACMLSVDYIFTEPYWDFNTTPVGFPLTLTVMLVVALTTAVITSRAKRAEAVFREAEKERIHSDLLRSVSHDIRTPLTGIVGATNVLLEQEDTLTPEQRHELLRDANEEAQWLIGVVENLLSITRLGASETQVNKTPELGEEIIETAVSKFRRRYAGVEVAVALPEEPLIVPADAMLLVQVLFNLMENAVIHGETTTCVTVRLSREGERAVFQVEDNGQGIAPERLGTLFDGHLKSSGGDMKRNMGIGLSVCQTVVRAHGGRIRGENTGHGARFTAELPLEKGEEA
jgi:two-component system sensor histidine kinase KdpD